ncbi:MAG: class II aldolase/adducin family protein [Candidatus Omnitrophica bacterium]|nr:class II aldolase/adducin family protein [Candidatus Omnitrophota bacterium]
MSKKLIKDLIKIGRKIEDCGLVIGEGGNISAKAGSVIYIKVRGATLASKKQADYIPIDIKTGKPLCKNGVPSTEIHMHLACYKARKDVGAVVHTHPVFITALGIAAVRLERVSYEAKIHLKGGIARIPCIKPGTKELGMAVGRAIAKHNIVMLKKHGLLTVGKNIKEAFLRTLAAERAAMVYAYSKRAKT